jgi:fluoride ion exporter CrcB/FEX
MAVISISSVLAVALGAFIGAPARAVLEKVLSERFHSTGFPVALSIVNIAGSFFAGIVLVNSSGDLQLFLLIGIAGTFTTFSGWAAAMRTGYQHRINKGRLSAGNWVFRVGFGVMLLCVVAAWLGTNIG